MSQVWSEQSYGTRVRQNSSTAITNTTTESDLVNILIPGGRLGVNKVVTFSCTCLITTPALSLPSIRIRGRFGNSVFLDTTAVSLALSQSNTPITLAGYISLNDASNSESAVCEIFQPSAASPIVLTGNSALQQVDMTEDTTVDLNFHFTVLFGALSAATSMQHKFTQVIMS